MVSKNRPNDKSKTLRKQHQRRTNSSDRRDRIVNMQALLNQAKFPQSQWEKRARRLEFENAFDALDKIDEIEAKQRGQTGAEDSDTTGRSVSPQAMKTHPLDSKPQITGRRSVIRKTLKLPHQDVCKRLDFEKVPLPESWRTKYDVCTWSDAYKKEDCRRCVKPLISKDRKKSR